MSAQIDLSCYDNSWFRPGRSFFVRALWMFAGQPVFALSFLPFSSLRVFLLRMFGADVGHRVVIHSGVQVKYPWHLVIGNDCWIGEQAWIDNLTTVRVGDNVCISQGAYLCTGNHDWKDPAFGLIVRPISLESGSWVGAKCVLLPGARLEAGSIVAAGSVTSGIIPPFEIHSGNPATFLRHRELRETSGCATGEMRVRS